MKLEKERLNHIECEKREREICEEEQRIRKDQLEQQKLEQEKIEKEQLLQEQIQLNNNAQLELSKVQMQENIHQSQQQKQQNQIVSELGALSKRESADQATPSPDKENERQEKLRRKQQTRENLRKEQEKLRLYKQKLNPQMNTNNSNTNSDSQSITRVYHQPIHYSFLEGRVWEQILPMDFCLILEKACMSIHLGFPFNDFMTDIKVFKESSLKSPEFWRLTELAFNDYMISFLPGLCYEILEEVDEDFNGHVNYQDPLEMIKLEKDYVLNEFQELVKNTPNVQYYQKEEEEKEDNIWRPIPIIIEPELSKFEITELSDESPSEDANAIMDDDNQLLREIDKNLLSSEDLQNNQKTTQRSVSSESRPFLEITEVCSNNPDDEEELSFVSCDNDHEVKIIVTQDESDIILETSTNISKSTTNDFSVEETANAQVCSLDNNNLNSNRSHNTSISDITLSQDSLLVIDNYPVTSDSNPDDVNKEIEQAFEHGLTTLDELHIKRDSGNHTATTEYDTDAEDSEDEFEQMRNHRMNFSREREAAPPERDIFEDDTETADFQLKLRHMPQYNSNNSNINNNALNSTETINNDQDIYVEEKQGKKQQHNIPELNEFSEETEEDIMKDDTDKCDDNDDPVDQDDDISMFPIQQSRSFDSGLPPVTPELNKLILTHSSKSLSSKSSSIISILERRVGSSLNITTPSPRKQSIEDLASSVENLKEKLLLIPKDSAETIQAVKERLARPIPTQSNPGSTSSNGGSSESGIGSLSRSRSWQGFSAAHRTSRQQAFWESQRYESNSEKDLSLPPPPEKVPDQVAKKLNRSSKSPSRYTRSRHYRPLSQSPLRDSSSPARNHIRLSNHHNNNSNIPNGSPCTTNNKEQERGSSCNNLEQVPTKLRQVGLSSSTHEKAGSCNSALESSYPKSADSSSSSEDEDCEETSYSYSCLVDNNDKMIKQQQQQQSILESGGDQEDHQNGDHFMINGDPSMMMMIPNGANANQDQDFDQDDSQRRQIKPPNQYFYRHHYLSIIQEEEEHSDLASCSSRASSRPGSIYGGVSGNGCCLRNNSFIDGNNISPETSPKRGHKNINNKRKTDSVGSDFSIESVNSLLSEEGSCQTYSSISTNKTDEAFKTLTHLLDNVNPPPASPPELSPGLLSLSSPDNNLMIKKEITTSSMDDSSSCKELTSALEHQLHEIEKQVKHKQQRQNQKPVTPNNNTVVVTDSSSSPTAKGSSSNNKFGSSMREMLKSVVSSQKNVLTKKVETIEHNPSINNGNNNSSVNSKVGKFFQTLTKNPLSKSNQSLAHSKESLNSNNFEQQQQHQALLSSNISKFHKTSATQAAVDSGKKRSKSLNSESRNTLSSGNKIRAAGELVGQQNTNTTRSKWIGKNPFDLDKSPANEVIHN